MRKNYKKNPEFSWKDKFVLELSILYLFFWKKGVPVCTLAPVQIYYQTSQANRDFLIRKTYLNTFNSGQT